MDNDLDQAKGRVKQAAGDLTDNDDLKREGKTDEKAGKLKETVHNTADKAEKALLQRLSSDGARHSYQVSIRRALEDERAERELAVEKPESVIEMMADDDSPAENSFSMLQMPTSRCTGSMWSEPAATASSAAYCQTVSRAYDRAGMGLLCACAHQCSRFQRKWNPAEEEFRPVFPFGSQASPARPAARIRAARIHRYGRIRSPASTYGLFAARWRLRR